MKKILLLITSILALQFVNAQDTITKLNGELVRAKITEISSTEIKYKKFDFQDGPTYVEKKSDIRYIRFSNGVKETFGEQENKTETTVNTPINISINNNTDYYHGPVTPTSKIDVFGNKYRYQGSPIGEKQMQTILLQTKDKEIINLVGQSKDAHIGQFIGFAAIPLGIVGLYCFEGALFTGNSNYLIGSGFCFIGAIACPIMGGIFKHNRMNYNKQAIKLYNERY